MVELFLSDSPDLQSIVQKYCFFSDPHERNCDFRIRGSWNEYLTDRSDSGGKRERQAIEID